MARAVVGAANEDISSYGEADEAVAATAYNWPHSN